MSISAIGNTYTYVYNTQTKKLSTANGTEDDFVKYFNGDIEGSESETLNGFDAQRKGDFERILMLIGWGKLAHNQIGDDTEIKISGTIVDGDTTEYTINDEAVFTAYVAPSFTPAEYQEISDIWASGEDYACTNDNSYPYPDSVYNKVLQRYEEWLYQPLSARVNTADIGSATRESSSSNNGKNIGVTLVGNTAYIARYADSSTPENPVIKIGDYEVSIKDVDPTNATELEMFALMAYLDDTNQTNNTGMSSFSKLSSFADLAEQNGLCEGIKDVDAFFSKNQNWVDIISAIKEVFLGNSQTYEQALDCEKLLSVMSGKGNYEYLHK